ncbi:SurA N-terminal domain-containing protein [Desulfovibrio sp. OttesenSCG-928-C06]|nr:SurA N-terminal domain-containing protein [Desulfovibrio sp. OttesenSCG-928-C06]
MLDIIRGKSRSLGVKIIFGLIIIVFVFWGASAVNTPSNQTLAKVNGEPVNAMDFQTEYQRTYEMLRNSPEFSNMDADTREELGQMVLSQMIVKELVRQEADKLGLGISDIELSYIVTRNPEFFGENGKFDPEMYKSRLALVGMTPGYYERMVSAELMTSKLQNYIGSSVNLSRDEARHSFNFEYERRVVDYLLFASDDFSALVTPSDEEITAHYEQYKTAYTVPAMADMDYILFDLRSIGNQLSFSDEELQAYYAERESSFMIPARYRSSHILISIPQDGTEANVAEAEAKAQTVLKELGEGKSFAELAKNYSDDAQSKDNGGDIGWFAQGQAISEYEEAAMAMKNGEISQPVRTPYGLHIIRLDGLEQARQKAFAEVKDELLELKREEESYKLLDKYLVEVEDVIITKPDLKAVAEQYKLPVKNTGFAGVSTVAELMGVKPEAFGDLGKLYTGQSVVLPMPIELKDAFVVVQVNKFEDTHIPTLEQVRDTVVAELRQAGALKLAMDEADKVSKEIQEQGKLPTRYASRVKESRPVDRFAGLTELGFSPILTESLFSAEQGKWLDTAFSTEGGAVLVMVKDVRNPSETEWSELGERFTAQTLYNRRSNLYNTYIGMLHKNAKIEVLVDRIFNRG